MCWLSEQSGKEAIVKLQQDLPKLFDTFDLHHCVGEGTFSSVYLATLKGNKHRNNEKFAVKHIVPTCHPDRITFELKCLKKLG